MYIVCTNHCEPSLFVYALHKHLTHHVHLHRHTCSSAIVWLAAENRTIFCFGFLSTVALTLSTQRKSQNEIRKFLMIHKDPAFKWLALRVTCQYYLIIMGSHVSQIQLMMLHGSKTKEGMVHDRFFHLSRLPGIWKTVCWPLFCYSIRRIFYFKPFCMIYSLFYQSKSAADNILVHVLSW